MFKAELMERAAQFKLAADDPARNLAGCPTLVLNADYTPLSYYPLSLWPWQTAIKAIFLDRVDVVASYEREVHSPSLDMKLPSVIALKQYVKQSEFPAFTRFNLFLRDRFTCQYCGDGEQSDLRSCHPAPIGRQDDVGEHRHRLRAVQHEEGRSLAQGRRHAAAPQTLPPDQLAIAATGQELPAQFPARDMDGLAVLGHRAGGLTGRNRAGN